MKIHQQNFIRSRSVWGSESFKKFEKYWKMQHLVFFTILFSGDPRTHFLPLYTFCNCLFQKFHIFKKKNFPTLNVTWTKKILLRDIQMAAPPTYSCKMGVIEKPAGKVKFSQYCWTGKGWYFIKSINFHWAFFFPIFK